MKAKCLVAGLCLLGALASAGPALAVFPGANGKILFVSGRGGSDATAGIYVIDSPADTTPTGPLDAITGQHRHPNFSPDGETIIAAVRSPIGAGTCPGNPTSDDDLILRTPDGTTSPYVLAPGPCLHDDHPTFSPNERLIAWESEITDGPAPNLGALDILIGPGDGTGSVRNLTSTTNASEATPVWSPDGRFIYYARTLGNSSEADIVRHPVQGSGTPQLILDAATAANEFQPEISPDGSRICYTRGAFGSAEADVMVARVDGSGDPVEINPTDMGGTAVADYDCGWSPDGKTIAFTRGAFGQGNLLFAPADGSGPPVPYGANSAFFDGNVDWARDPRRCAERYITVAGTPGDDNLTGTSGPDVIHGFGGKDTIAGLAGKDRLCGGAGNDTLRGGADRDKLLGGVGRDTLEGGVARDDCTGGPGKDKAKNCERRKAI